MRENCQMWLPHLGLKNTMSNHVNYNGGVAMSNTKFPPFASSELPQSRLGQGNEPHGWFYCLPSFQQPFTAAPCSIVNEKVVHPDGNSMGKMDLGAGTGCAQKKFLVVDQSGDQTTVIFSAGTGTPVQCLTSWGPKPDVPRNFSGENLETKADLNPHLKPVLAREFDINSETDVQSEMHEDTEELNALLYSDDEEDSDEDDEVTSTGHSPSTMAQNKRDWFEASTEEEVASSTGPTKKQKTSNGGYVVPSVLDTACSFHTTKGSLMYEDDAESSCGKEKCYFNFSDVPSLSPDKKMTKEKIRESVGILQSIIPGFQGKEPIVVLDEAIQYLKSLKLKAIALGLDAR